MTPKEKAKALYTEYKKALGLRDTKTTANPFAQKCALIAADEMLNSAGFIWGGTDTETGKTSRDMFRDYWTEVKQEIEKL